jgi:uncharacterized membrane protein
MFESIVLVIGGTLSGLLAGLLFTFSNTIVPSLRAVSAREHIRIAQAINVKILNPIFMITFMGPSLILPLAAFLLRAGAEFPYLVTASALQIIGVFGVTGGGNVPLNNALDKVDVNGISDAEAEQIRQNYQGVGSRWMNLHIIRTLAATIATVLVFIACLVRSTSR